jgi:hypothetical protein
MALAIVAPLLAAASAPAAAQPHASARLARLEVDAPASCSTRDELVARVAARSTRIRFVHDEAGVPSLIARIEPAARGTAIADLTVVEPDGRKFSRRIEAPSCAAATDALALVVAITLDPRAATREASGAAATATAGAAAGAGKAGDVGAAGGAMASQDGAGPGPPAAPGDGQATPEASLRGDGPAGGGGDVTEAAGPSVRRVTAAVAAGAVSGPAPILMPGIALEAVAAYDRPSVWSPALVLTVTRVWSGGLKESGGTAEFTLDLLGLDACPVRLALLALEARVCAAGTVGRLAARGTNTYDPRSVARPFAAAGGTIRLAVPLGSRVEVRARFGAAASLWRDAFEFTPEVFHRVASVTLVGDVGVGVRFP